MHTKINQTMEKDSENILLKSRSSRACIRDGYRFYFSNFKRIFKATCGTPGTKPGAGRLIVGNGGGDPATHRCLADTP